MKFAKKFLNLFSLKRFKVEGRSMQPSLHPGDRVIAFTDKHSLQRIMENELVIAKNPAGKTILKRVQKIHGNKFFLTGDNKEESTDSREFGLLERERIIGKVWKKY